MNFAIQIDAVSKTYRKSLLDVETKAVSEISIEVPVGEAFGFIGPNGAGKTTTIKMLMGLAFPSSGRLSLFGIPVAQPESRRNIGYVPENPSLPDYSTPLELLLMALRLHGVQVADQRRCCFDWLERFDLARVANKTIRSFSKGMVQRTALAHAMAVQPRLLILDEPLSGLDPIGRRDVVDILSEYKREGGTLFFTSHVLHDVERLADRFGLIHQGKLRAVQSPAELAGEEEIVQVRSLGSAVVAGMQEEFSGRWTCAIPRSQLWLQLDALKAAGHVLLEVKPTLSLEAAFMRTVGRVEA